MNTPHPLVSSMAQTDFYNNYTPDLPLFRFKGPQKFFIWDSCLKSDFFSGILELERLKDYRVDSWLAFTRNNYIPIREKGVSYSDGVLISQTDWRNLITEKQRLRWRHTTPLPVKGRVYSLSLKAIRELDCFLQNQVFCKRFKIPIITLNTADGKTDVYAWTYFTTLSTIAKYNPHTREFKFPESFDGKPLARNYTSHPTGVSWEYPLNY